jgi:hypothetical protein
MPGVESSGQFVLKVAFTLTDWSDWQGGCRETMGGVNDENWSCDMIDTQPGSPIPPD